MSDQVLIQVGRVDEPESWRMPWRPGWRVTRCADCNHRSWVSPKGRAIKVQHPDARIVCSRCWPIERVEAEMDEVTVL